MPVTDTSEDSILLLSIARRYYRISERLTRV